MSKTFAMVAAAALFASVTAFAQTSALLAPASDQRLRLPPLLRPMTLRRSRKMPTCIIITTAWRVAPNGSTDHDADKLNACMSNATPTDQQEQCLKQASGTGNS